MYRRLFQTMFLSCFLFFISALNAATVSWQSSTQNAVWVDKGPLTTSAWDNDNTSYVSIDEKATNKEIFGFGGCFNEVGWKVLMKLSPSTRDSVMRLLFDSVSGCNFNVCRVPIGANDYTIAPYSLNETANDYTMANFSIDHDQQYLIPYIKAAMAFQPSLKIWGSPWSVPTWMKDSKAFNSGSIVENANNFSALALYFAKAVKAYQQQGLHYFAIMPANEPNWAVSMGYPVTAWTAAKMQNFIKNYLGPQFKTDDVPGEIYLGTLLNDGDASGNPVMTANVYADSVAYSYCTGGGYQYSLPVSARIADKTIFETETPCGTVGGFNNANDFWNYAMGNDDNMQSFIGGGTNVYSQWNMILDTSGSNIAKWRQFAMIMIDTVGKKVTVTPQYYQVKHYSAYVKPGAYRINTAGNASNIAITAFRNPNGENVLILTNKGNSSATVAINLNGQKIKPSIPARSFNTFRIAGTPIPSVSAFTQIEAENFSRQSGVLIRPCSDGGNGVTLTQDNDWTIYHNVDFGIGAQSFEARVSGAAGGSIEVHLDSSNGPASGTLTVPAASAWSKLSCPVTGVSGKHTLYLKFKGTGTGNLMNLNWFDFILGTSSVRTTSQSISAQAKNRLQKVVYNGSALSIPAKSGSVGVYDLSGKLVYSTHTNGQAKAITNSGLRRGIYIVK